MKTLTSVYSQPLTHNHVIIIEQMMIESENGIYLKVNDASAVVPEYRQKSYGKYKLRKLFR